MTCQNHYCDNETEGYDMYCKECQQKDNEIYQTFLKMDNERNKDGVNKNES